MVLADELTASDLAAIIVAISAVVGVVVVVFALVSLTRTLTAVRFSVEEMRRETLPVIDELLARHEGLSARMMLLDRNVRIIEEGIDVAVIMNALRASWA